VKEEVEKRTGDNYKVRIKDVRKNNGIVLSGLTVMADDSNISPTIYLNQYYDAYQNGDTTLISVINEVLDIYNTNKVEKNIDMEYFLNFNKVKERIVYKLINTEKNKELLEDVPHVEFLDLSIVFQCLVASKEESTASILIHNAHMKLWNTTTEEIYKAARNNTQNLLGYDIKNMNDIVSEIMEFEGLDDIYEEDDMKGLSENVSMYILTNKNRIDGAAGIIYPNLLRDFALSIDSGFYVIPSSVHEVILVPSEDTYDSDRIRLMIQEINDTQVKAEEILSYSLYYFDKEENKLFNLF
jgi:hypothetical protein